MASLAEKSNKPLDPTKVFASGKALRTIATDAGTVQFTIQTYRGPKAPGKDKFDVAFDPPLGEVTIVDKADGSHTVTAVVPADADAGMKTITITVAIAVTITGTVTETGREHPFACSDKNVNGIPGHSPHAGCHTLHHCTKLARWGCGHQHGHQRLQQEARVRRLEHLHG